MRINKFLSEAGVCSRRAGDRAIAQGRVTINEKIAVLGDTVESTDTVCFDGKPVTREDPPVLIAFHKPVGIVCTSSSEDPENIIDFLHYPVRIYTAGRLDKDSEGLILLTNQGDLVNKIMRAGNFHEKEYIVSVRKPITEAFIKGMANGVYLKELDVTTRPCKVAKLSDTSFRIILTQGYNRQIRRMCKALSNSVVTLKRIRIMNIRLGDLKVGEYRDLTAEEWTELQEGLKHSYSTPVSEQKSGE